MRPYEIYEMLASAVFSSKCFLCEEYIDTGKAICDKCYIELSNAKREYSIDTRDKNIRSCFCLYYYTDELVEKLVFDLKNNGDRDLCRFFADELYERIKFRGLANLIDVITFVPRRVAKKLARGHDQSQILAKALSFKMNIPCRALLKRRGRSVTQHNLRLEDRKRNVAGKFIPKGDIKDKNILIIDDIITSGVTMAECTKILKRAGAKNIYVMGIAH